jgi:pyridoxal phosphate enzyme (YggS family)
MQRTTTHVTREQASAGLARVRARVNEAAATSGRAGGDVRILAAVKYVDAASCAALVEAGVADLAENRYGQLVDKHDALAEEGSAATWHFIGRLQSREAPAIAERVAMIHALASESAARRLDGAWERAEATGRTRRPQVLVQVNVDGDPGKDGVPAGEVERFLADLPARVRVDGFMTMPAFAEDPQASRPAFSALRELRDRLAPRFSGRHDLRALSMGTSQDFAVAVEEGATHVRLGRILFGGGE